MSVFISVGIVLLAMLIMIFLQLVPGVFAIFCHYATGKYSRRRVSDLGMFFILGAETVAACLFLSCYYIAYVLFFGDTRPETGMFAWIAVEMLVVLAVASFFFYYRGGDGTRLFVPRKTAHSLNEHAKSVKTRSDAFTLGALCGTYELAFTLPLYIITSVELMEMNAEYYFSHFLTILYIVTPTIPLFVMRWMFLRRKNLADIEKSRVKDKPFTRFLLAFCYLTIAILIICFRINS